MTGQPGFWLERNCVTSASMSDLRNEIPSVAPTRTLEKGLFLLGLFDVEHPEWSLKELRERAGLPKATTRRLMKTLEAANWVAYDSESGRFHLGSSALRALYLAMSHSELTRTAHPFLAQLTEETTESSSLCRVGRSRRADHRYRPDRPRFQAFHLRRHASRRQRKRRRPGADSVRVGAHPGDGAVHPPATSHAIHGGRRPRAPGEVRTGEVRGGRLSTAVNGTRRLLPSQRPVFDRNGELRASVSVVAPPERCNEEQMRSYAEAVKKTAAELSFALGYRGVATPRRSPSA